MTRWVLLICWLGLCLVVAFAGSQANATSLTEWYPTLRKPSFTPPNWIFAPVWTALYCMMAVAAWRINLRVHLSHPALLLFLLQLFLNLMWSILFFGMQEIGFALVDIVFLDIAVFVTLVLFRRLDPLAASMLAPYLGWLLFATALNLRIFQLNN